MFPTPLAILLFCAPESPWWLVRKGRLEEAAKSVRRLGRASILTNPDESVAMMRRTIELEKSTREPSILELFRGTDTYRTLIVCGVYAAQNLTGNLIANQAVYFFRRELFPSLAIPAFCVLSREQRPALTRNSPSPSVSSPRPCRPSLSCSPGS
jgi:sugar transport protein